METIVDGIADNPKKFEFVGIEDATRPQALPDLDAAFVTISFAPPAGLSSDQAINAARFGQDTWGARRSRFRIRLCPIAQCLIRLCLIPSA